MITAAQTCGSDWPSVVMVVGVAWAAAIGYAAWRFTGGRHVGERRK